MDVVVIFNGLGNQMSQYAYYLAKKKVNPNTKVIFDIMSKHNHYGYDLERAFGIEVNNWVMNLGYDLSLGDEGGNYKIDGDNFSLYEVRSVGANYNTMSLTVGYKFKL